MKHWVLACLLTLATMPPATLYAQSIPILSLTFEGNATLNAAQLKAQMRMSRDGGWYNPESLRMELQNLQKYYQDEGFLKAKVGTPSVEQRTVPGRGEAVAIRVPIEEGPRYNVGEITVKDAQVFKPATLLQMSPLRTGQPYSRRRLNDWKDKIEGSYQTMGYIRIEINVVENIHDFRHVVDFALELKEGNPYRVGKINVTGDDSVNPVEFKKLLLLGQGSLYNPEMVSLSIAFLNNMRAYRHISDSDVEVKIDDTAHTVDLTFRVVSLRKPTSS